MRVTGYDAVMPLPKLEDHYVPTFERIRKTIEEVLKYYCAGRWMYFRCWYFLKENTYYAVRF